MVYLEGVKLDCTQLREQDDCSHVTDHARNSNKIQVGIFHLFVGSLNVIYTQESGGVFYIEYLKVNETKICCTLEMSNITQYISVLGQYCMY